MAHSGTSDRAKSRAGFVESSADLSADPSMRDYVESMCVELARMARSEGDEFLARALDVAAELARRSPFPNQTPTNSAAEHSSI